MPPPEDPWNSYRGAYALDPDSNPPVYYKNGTRLIRLNNAGDFVLDDNSLFSTPDFSTAGSEFGSLVFTSLTQSPIGEVLGTCALENPSFEVVNNPSRPIYTDLTGVWKPVTGSDTIYSNDHKWCVVGDATYFYETLAQAQEDDSSLAFAVASHVILTNTPVNIEANDDVTRDCGVIRRIADDIIAPSSATTYGTGVVTYKFGEGEAEVDPATPGGRLNPVQVPAGMFRSYVSAEALENDILGYVTGNLSCGWANDPMVVRCGATIPSGPASGVEGGLKGPELDEAGGYWYKDSTGHKVYSPIVVDEEQFFSAESPGHANLLALLLGHAQLDCFYFAEVSPGAPCGVKEPERAGITTLQDPNSYGTAGEAVSYISQADALAKAKLVASSAATCLFLNNATEPDPCPVGTTVFSMPDGCYNFSTGTVVEGCREIGESSSMTNSTSATDELKTALNAERVCMPPESLEAATQTFRVSQLCPLEVFYEYGSSVDPENGQPVPSRIAMKPGTIQGGNSINQLNSSDVMHFDLPTSETPTVIALEVILRPATIQLSSSGNNQMLWHILGVQAVMEDNVIEYTGQVPVRATINPTTGVTTDGTYYIVLASYYREGSEEGGYNYVMNSCVCGPLLLSLGPNGELWMQKS